ncbi:MULTISPECIES: hypothetical protein [unclassified Sedimentibacter]|uniref:hypothetical protein n=1 Tax=unclassified Sedimentibacter TaxID=2649220 RepID=UPI0027E2118A|nr:hypothetical protein [Sedimentibacter sp. MB35-C1]WMJ76246.1 hypothetical protein RBQ61_11480 [Sedimentibacter sp. MB35-C1]
MIWIKSMLFVLTIVTVKLIFKFINDYGDKCIASMEELLNFTDYLRTYSCDMKLSYEEIYLKYNYKNDETKKICNKLQEHLIHKKNKYELENFMKELIHTPDDFNKYFSDIVDYYGSAYSDVLNKKLLFTIREMENSMKGFVRSHTEKKNLNNRISILVGCLAAVILI